MRSMSPLLRSRVASIMRAFVLAAAVLTSSVGSAEPPTLHRRLEEAERAPEAPVAEGALRQAREALSRAGTLPPEAAERARRIADAALTLAERRIARARAEAGRRDAENHRRDALRRAEIAREALEHARQPVQVPPASVAAEAEEKP